MTEGEKKPNGNMYLSSRHGIAVPPSRCGSVTLAFCRFPEAAFIPLVPLRYPQERALGYNSPASCHLGKSLPASSLSVGSADTSPGGRGFVCALPVGENFRFHFG